MGLRPGLSILPDWLRRTGNEPPSVAVNGRHLPVEIRRLAHARRLTLRLAPDGSAARVTIPHWTPTAEAMAFVRARADWLEGQLAKLPAESTLADGATLPFRGQSLRIEHVPATPRRVRIAGGVLQVGGPAEGLPARLRRWLEGEARMLLAADLADYCASAGLECPRLLLSNAQRRWGSCSAKGELRLNWRLVMAPDSVRRSVVAHEVTHLLHFDHSPRFHATLARLYEGDIHEADRWLKRHGRELYRFFG